VPVFRAMKPALGAHDVIHAAPSLCGPLRKPVSLLHNAGQRLWEPSWEPFSVDCGGLLWTPVESRPSRFGMCGLLWTPVDGAWGSTDQKDGACRKRQGRVLPGVLWEPLQRKGLGVSQAPATV